jgi:autophagy-related protein 18
MNFVSSVLSLRVNLERLVVCLEDQIHIFDVPHMKCLVTLTTPKNPNGLLALSKEGSSFLAFPSRREGELVLYDAVALKLLSQVP